MIVFLCVRVCLSVFRLFFLSLALSLSLISVVLGYLFFPFPFPSSCIDDNPTIISIFIPQPQISTSPTTSHSPTSNPFVRTTLTRSHLTSLNPSPLFPDPPGECSSTPPSTGTTSLSE